MRFIPKFLVILVIVLVSSAYAENYYSGLLGNEFDTDNKGVNSPRRLAESFSDADFLINDDVTGGHVRQDRVEMAHSPNGYYVIVWADYRYEYPHVYGQIYDRERNPVGDNFQVSQSFISYETEICVGMNNSGYFIVAWTIFNDPFIEIHVQRFEADGKPVGNNIILEWDAAFFDDPSIAVDGRGFFYISLYEIVGGAESVYARRYDNLGNPLGSRFKVNEDGDWVGYVDIASDSLGNIVIVWGDNRNFFDDDRFKYNIFAQRYDASGDPLGENIRVDNDLAIAHHWGTQVALNDAGKFVITWLDQRDGPNKIYSQIFDDKGSPVGTNFQVSADSAVVGVFGMPGVTINQSGEFVIVWSGRGTINDQVLMQKFNALGEPDGIHIRATALRGYYPDIGSDSHGNILLTWVDSRVGGNSKDKWDIYAQKYDVGGFAEGDNFRVSDDEAGAIQYSPAIAVDDQGNYAVVWCDGRGESIDIYIQKYDALGSTLGENLKINSSSLNNKSIWDWQRYTAMAMNGAGNGVIVWAENGLFEGDGGITAQRFNHLGDPIGDNFKVNDGEIRHIQPYVAMNDSGDFVVVWSSEIFGIRAQRFDKNGLPIGSNIKVIDNMFHNYSPVVAIYEKGGFVVCWWNNQSDNLLLNIYDSIGTLTGSTIVVNERPGMVSLDCAMTMSNNGDFIVTWKDKGDDGADIYARHFTASGEPDGGEFKINDDAGVAEQGLPAVAMDEFGNYLIAWRDYRNGVKDIYAQAFNLNGDPVGENFLVPDPLNSIYLQSHPAVAMTDNKIVFVWQDNRRAKRWDIFGKTIVKSPTDADSDIVEALPIRYHLSHNYPNPFNPTTTIEYNVPTKSHIAIEVFNILGQKIRTLVDESKPAGKHQILWDGIDANGLQVSTGIYLYRIRTGDYEQIRKMLLLK